MSKQEAKGIAAGLLFAAILLTAYYFMFSQAKAEESNEVTDAMIKQHLEEKGMVMVAKEKYDSLKAAEHPDNENSATEIKKEEAANKPEEIKFTIKEGMTSQEVAQSLQDQMLVKKSDDFIKALRDMDKEMAVQPGDYTLKADMSSAEIVEEITR
ncbi:endolytic transglycosylase MltG [Guptibacillus hwajinpoensis]|uniref:endolytic transglycosylase MltG n=1 Tax=Guptibacillus hwajinpoensis TaxID=208199 RepID=UPI001CD3E05D|nr:endolytic transglycosylase MltG [Pseudalkalibacillus hwajinpoensis]MCA0993275.1 endolytic transglycosylase MltG [Pseudalkalibacillus hwajinpoensis]